MVMRGRTSRNASCWLRIALQPPACVGELHPEREVEKGQVPIQDDKAPSQTHVYGKKLMVADEQRKGQKEREPARVDQMTTLLLPAASQALPRDGEIPPRHRRQDKQLGLPRPLLVLGPQIDPKEDQPSHDAGQQP